MRLSPSHPEAYHHMGIIYREYFKDLKMSKYYIKKALILDPKYPMNSYQLGLTYKQMGDIEEAKKLFKRSLELRPNYKDAEVELVKLNSLQV